jgi:hypothetical protein
MQHTEYIITKHAAIKLQERLRAHPRKHLRITQKAWACKDTSQFITKRLEYQRQFTPNRKYIRYREMMGWLFVFEQVPTSENTQRVQLITIY